MWTLLLALAALLFAYRRIFVAKAARRAAVAPPLSAELRRLRDEALRYSCAQRPPLLVLYATEYGFAREVALHVAACLAPFVSVRVLNVSHYSLVDFASETFMLFICSTTGDGVPPTEAADFRDALAASHILLPASLHVAVLALGDRAYPHFCRAGAIFDALFATCPRLVPRTDVNQENWQLIQNWTDRVSSAIAPFVQSPPQSPSDYLPAALLKYLTSNRNTVRYSANNPYMATMCSRTSLTSQTLHVPHPKEVVRVEFAVEPDHIQYTVGDALAVIPSNNLQHVTRLLLLMAVNGHELVRLQLKDRTLSLEEALTHHLDIATVKPELVAHLARRSTQSSEQQLAARILGNDLAHFSLTELGNDYLHQREVFEILCDFKTVPVSPQQLVDHLRPLHARYYSISSTPISRADRIAITVDVLRYTSLNVDRQGVASTYLTDRCVVNKTKVPIFISRNPNFRLPKDNTKPIVMIGPGTGIAPFIAFVEERLAGNASGQNWLFFGCRHQSQDFLYKEKLRKLAEKGHLKLYTAFSRDGPQKMYVQHRMKECAQQLWELMEQGAHLYVCGDGRHMSADVDNALGDIIVECSGFTLEQAKTYLQLLADQKRYQRDVWIS
ncbi:unnamed protein product [Agarophyton chilense]|eukprot:gb/GEZJ01003280.1/.p1 GENE.gb/GEZJ01003280.1/~~gb/GEZJ01003280.1/.p1  ORF type:complete len:614 (-),score=89.88 gb/GEZJ01003280.1/:2245-4086(-)